MIKCFCEAFYLLMLGRLLINGFLALVLPNLNRSG